MCFEAWKIRTKGAFLVSAHFISFHDKKRIFFFFPVWSSNHNPWGNSWASGGGENNLYIWILQKLRHHQVILDLIFHSAFFSPIVLFMYSSAFPFLQRDHQSKHWTSWLLWFIKRRKCDQNTFFFCLGGIAEALISLITPITLERS